MPALLGLQIPEIEQLLGPGQPRFRARQIYSALYRERLSDLLSLTTLPLPLRRELAATHVVGLPVVQRRFDSADGARRYLLQLADGRTVEAVFMPEEDRQTVCISTQVGCPVNCKFCLTALLGLERNLTVGEIVGQVLLLAADSQLAAEGERLNVVMMGQGEPLLNLPNVLKATRILLDPAGCGLSPRRVTLSTAGIIPGIEELGREAVRPRLAVSLNASSDQMRRELMPIARKYPLRELLEACRAYPLRPRERLTFEYVLLKGVNDSDADAHRVVKLLARLKCKVNLIALNPGPEIPFETPEPDRVLAFQRILKRAVPCFIRKPRGRDVFAACGQLRRISSPA
jgi:23S rRNA (adenine2503-C2)-methyltransferase